jgi:hypothetical protein
VARQVDARGHGARVAARDLLQEHDVGARQRRVGRERALDRQRVRADRHVPRHDAQERGHDGRVAVGERVRLEARGRVDRVAAAREVAGRQVEQRRRELRAERDEAGAGRARRGHRRGRARRDRRGDGARRRRRRARPIALGAAGEEREEDEGDAHGRDVSNGPPRANR